MTQGHSVTGLLRTRWMDFPSLHNVPLSPCSLGFKMSRPQCFLEPWNQCKTPPVSTAPASTPEQGLHLTVPRLLFGTQALFPSHCTHRQLTSTCIYCWSFLWGLGHYLCVVDGLPSKGGAEKGSKVASVRETESMEPTSFFRTFPRLPCKCADTAG